jgi:acetyl-CoA carboxylase carboxyl transferase subunit beta
MSWLDKLLPPKIKQTDPKSRKGIPEGLWVKCPSCEAVLYRTDVDANLTSARSATTTCASARERLDALLDPEGRYEIGQEIVPVDALKFKDSRSTRTAQGSDGRHRRDRRDGGDGRRDPHAAGGRGLLRVRVHGRLDGLGGRRALRAARRTRSSSRCRSSASPPRAARACRKACCR